MTRAAAEPSPLGLLAEGRAALRAAGLADARQSAEWLLAAVIGGGRFGAYLEPSRALSRDQVHRYRGLVDRRAAREPLQHLVGAEDFAGVRLAVTSDVLIPRPETEGLVEWAAEILAERPGALVADIGTGSGAIACALARRVPDVRVVAVDCSEAALAVARRNVEALQLGDRIALFAGDLLAPLRTLGLARDLIVANLPYLPSRIIPSLPAEVSVWEPRIALDGGPDGLSLLRRIVIEAAIALSIGGWLLVEVGEEQSAPVAGLMTEAGFIDIECRRDLNGVERHVGGRWARDPDRALFRSPDCDRASGAGEPLTPTFESGEARDPRPSGGEGGPRAR